MSESKTQLESALTDLSRWDDPNEPTWAAAAKELTRAGTANHARHWWNKSARYAPIAAVILFGCVLVAAIIPTLGKARAVGRGNAPASSPAKQFLKSSESLLADIATAAPLAPTDRSIIRRSDIEFLSPDVRASFARLPGLLSEVRGEYIEQSSFSGTGANTVASATLRVPTDRLGSVLAALRGLGTLSSESSNAEDVTEQVVDVDARLRNEQRVEKELLSLLESRSGSPLKEILDLRESLKTVREQIERLSAQQQRIDRLVSLATIRVSIRTEPSVPVAEVPQGFWRVASDRIAATWNDSLKVALNAFATLLAIVVGGAVWWVLLVLAVLAGLAMRRRYLRHTAFEPPPRF